MRIWRALKACGAGTLRDGVYLLPESKETRAVLEEQMHVVEKASGTAYLLTYCSETARLGKAFRRLFDRTVQYDKWLERVAEFINGLVGLDEAEARRTAAQLRRDFESLADTDYFPGVSKARAVQALHELADTLNNRYSPDEPTARAGRVGALTVADFAGRVWATRRGLWVDRVASAWLIRRFIDPNASFLWLATPSDCPPNAIGFDFDGATFSHIEDLVTFEVLLQAFALVRDPALAKLGTLVHYLDVGGVPVPEAAGFLAMLAGAKHHASDDDAVLEAGGALLDHLYAAYAQAEAPAEDG